MSGTVSGGLRAAKTNLKKYGNDFYRNIGREGGKRGHTGGVAGDPERAKEIGRLGGSVSKRGWTYIGWVLGSDFYVSSDVNLNARQWKCLQQFKSGRMCLTIVPAKNVRIAAKQILENCHLTPYRKMVLQKLI